MLPLPARLPNSGFGLSIIAAISLSLLVAFRWLLHRPMYPVDLCEVDGHSVHSAPSTRLIAFPTSPSVAELDADDELHIAMVFDNNRLHWPQQLVRSIAFHTNLTASFHLVMNVAMQAVVGEQLLSDPRITNIRLHFYDIALCEPHTRLVSAFAHPMCPTAVMCKLFMPAILPQRLERVLLVDSDATAVQDVQRCYQHPMTDEQQVAMGVDMGEVCQQYPDRCWPIGFSIAAQAGLRCGTPLRPKMNRQPADAVCPADGDLMPFQFNGGVMLLHLSNMRRLGWVQRFVQVAARTARHIGFKQAHWCEQDLINNFFRVYPSAVTELPCGCNYQFGGLRRDLHCPKQPIYIAHAWHAHVKRRTNNSYNALFYYWLVDHVLNRTLAPPPVHVVSGIAQRNVSDWAKVPRPSALPQRVSHHGACPLQPEYGNCSFHSKSELATAAEYGAVVNVLTLLAGNVAAFHDLRRSLLTQSYPFVRHLVFTAGHDKLEYAAGDVVLATPAVEGKGAEKQCEEAADDGLRELHRHVAEGWVLYMGEEQLLSEPSSLSVLLAHATSTRSVVVWKLIRSTGDVVVADRGEGHSRDEGELLVGGFMFHSSQLSKLAMPARSCISLASQWAAMAAELVREQVQLVTVIDNSRVEPSRRKEPTRAQHVP